MWQVLITDFSPEVAAKCMNRLAKLSARFIGDRGFSIGIDDVSPAPALQVAKAGLVRDGCASPPYIVTVELLSSQENIQFQAGQVPCAKQSKPDDGWLIYGFVSGVVVIFLLLLHRLFKASFCRA